MPLGRVVGVLGSVATACLAAAAGITGTEYGQWFARYGLQYGSLVLAVTYILYREPVGRFVRIGRPDLEGIAWVVLAPVALIGSSFVIDPVLTSIGIERAASDPGPDPIATLSQFAVFFVAAWLVAAPAEELLFRGCDLGPAPRDDGCDDGSTIAAIVFSLVHAVFGVLEGHSIGGIVD